MEGSKLFQFAILLAIVTGACAWCAAWNEGGALKICKEKDKKGCDKLQSEDKCVNLEKEENWVSGHAVGEELQCIIYKNHDCKGAFVSVEHEGWAEFPIKPKSFTCPCVAKEKKKD